MRMVQQRPSDPTTLVIETLFCHTSAETVFNYLTQPALLQQWWPQEATIEPCCGGQYHLSWPQMNWHLRGQYLCFEPGARLTFTWHWDHDEEGTSETVVDVIIEQAVNGDIRLQLTQGPYAETPEDQNLRLEHHLPGWLHFLPRLQACVQATGR
ncbi:SRPBCC family protein [Tengunoibacter tsumagoiensis]|uniref:Activator of Hsp90 ATPase homologue 1/2-like C-terminal domain-containing protein n=1 Tax=Tengunoibacter tsumagoiensis TaxID=2014871 RepID=A0A402A088_9CHLR|nr:SRPBCC domain-containing protein [Tengunoibacter tsumagoiensis]GCE12476.1 hypothetical protein KTT_23350 [Tengunoibacter tsumagoiensis]